MEKAFSKIPIPVIDIPFHKLDDQDLQPMADGPEASPKSGRRLPLSVSGID